MSSLMNIKSTHARQQQVGNEQKHKLNHSLEEQLHAHERRVVQYEIKRAQHQMAAGDGVERE